MPVTGAATLVRLTPEGGAPGGRAAGRAAGRLAELLAKLPQADQRHLLQALESLRAVLTRHPER
jgi:hypothetical protein